MATDKIRLASVGIGRWACVLARAACRGDVIDLVNCYTRDQEKRDSFREEFGVARGSASYEELLADDEVEGVLITTPNDVHKPFILQALEAGKAVYTDKPIAHTAKDGAEIAEAVAESGQVFAVGHSARRLGGTRAMKQWLDRGHVGDVSLAEANFSNERGLELTPDTWRWYADKDPGGALIQLGVHHVDNLRYLLGPVRSVSAHARRLHTPAEVTDAVMSVLEFDSGPLGYVGTGWASPGVYTLSLQGTKTNMRYSLDFSYWKDSHLVDGRSSLFAQQLNEWEGSVVDIPQTDMLREQLEEFALAARGEATVEVDASEGLQNLAVVEAALESSSRGGDAIAPTEILKAAGERS